VLRILRLTDTKHVRFFFHFSLYFSVNTLVKNIFNEAFLAKTVKAELCKLYDLKVHLNYIA